MGEPDGTGEGDADDEGEGEPASTGDSVGEADAASPACESAGDDDESLLPPLAALEFAATLPLFEFVPALLVPNSVFGVTLSQNCSPREIPRMHMMRMYKNE